MKPARDILKHSSIYAVGQILSRFASVLLLPLYTRCLSTADYGCVAILDLTAGILAILIGAGMSQAVVRYHFDAKGEAQQSRVWWSGFSWILVAATAVVTPLVLFRGTVAQVTLGSAISDGAFFYLLAAATLWMNTVGSLLETYLRVRKWSGTYVVVSMGRLLLNIGLNVWFLVGLELGVTGLLLGNLIAASLNTVVLLGVFVRSQNAFAVDAETLKGLLRFGSPLIVQAFLSLMMHEADRFLLRTFGSLESVGVYSLAYKVGQAVNTLVLIPFASVWNVVLYEIAQQPDAPKNYANVFRYYVYGLLVVMLAASLFAYPVLPVLTPGAFGAAVDLVPVILLAFVFFSMHSQFSVPALLAKRTSVLIPASVAGVIVNVVANCALIPQWGAMGAAWASVATYAAFSFVGLLFYRQIDRYPYPFARCGLAALGVAGTYVGVRYGLFPHLTELWTQAAVATVVSLLWTGILCARAVEPIIGTIERKTGRRILKTTEASQQTPLPLPLGEVGLSGPGEG
jgi:O-antigen/teichoic acid export membrane protein